MITTPQEQEANLKKAQVLVDLDVVETSFEKWAKPGHFSRTLQKVQNNNMDLNLHADAHDFDKQNL
jgi:photosystem I P700 chlorophyll a apoprotein A1